MNPLDISSIPPLDTEAFAAIFQSIARFEKAKNTALPLSYLPIEEFLQKTWANYNFTEEEQANALKSFEKMFNVELEKPKASDAFSKIIEEAFVKWQNSEQTVTFFTSGSTGIPKPCVHHESHLRQELIGIVPNYSQTKRAIVSVPLHHLYGFTFGLLLPRALQVPVAYEVPFPASIKKSLQEYDLLVATPLLHDHLSNIEELSGENIYCVSGSAALAEGTFLRMIDRGFHFFEHFGSSELGVMCFRDHPDKPFTLLPQFVSKNADGSLIRLLPDNTELLCPVQDTIDWIDERHFRPKGRKDFAVQVGSTNVFPSHVKKILESHPHIAQCLVRLMRPEEGNRLKAFIVPTSDCDIKELKKDLKQFMFEKLSAAERPASLTFGETLPKNLIDKPTDW